MLTFQTEFYRLGYIVKIFLVKYSINAWLHFTNNKLHRISWSTYSGEHPSKLPWKNLSPPKKWKLINSPLLVQSPPEIWKKIQTAPEKSFFPGSCFFLFFDSFCITLCNLQMFAKILTLLSYSKFMTNSYYCNHLEHSCLFILLIALLFTKNIREQE